MENKFNKILAALLAALLLSLAGAALYIFREPGPSENQDFQTSAEHHRTGSPLSMIPSPEPAGPKPGPEIPQKTAPNPQTDGPMAVDQPRQIPRHLTEAQQAENQRELARMAEALPDNMWVPKAPTPGYAPEQGEKLRKAIELGDKIRKGTATKAEAADYYTYKLKEVRDKIALIRYIARRTEELRNETGNPYLTENDIVTGFERIEELEHQALKWQEKLDTLSRKN